MKRICIVCRGNICRSPMGEFILKDMVKKGEYHVESRATHTDEIDNGVGNPVYPPALRELARRGVPCEAHRATLLQSADYHRFDLFLCMDDANLKSMLSIFGGDPAHKLHKLLSYTDAGGNVADPWYTRDFSAAFLEISAGCEGFLASETSGRRT